jgi:hypothetical protein
LLLQPNLPLGEAPRLHAVAHCALREVQPGCNVFYSSPIRRGAAGSGSCAHDSHRKTPVKSAGPTQGEENLQGGRVRRKHGLDRVDEEVQP